MSKLCHLLRGNVHFLKGSSGTQLEYVTKMHVPERLLALVLQVSGAISPKL
jgi:hypothetical protein